MRLLAAWATLRRRSSFNPGVLRWVCRRAWRPAGTCEPPSGDSLLRSTSAGVLLATSPAVRLASPDTARTSPSTPDAYHFAELAWQLGAATRQLSAQELQVVAAAAPAFEWPVYRDSLVLLHAVCREAVHRCGAGQGGAGRLAGWLANVPFEAACQAAWLAAPPHHPYAQVPGRCTAGAGGAVGDCRRSEGRGCHAPPPGLGARRGHGGVCAQVCMCMRLRCGCSGCGGWVGGWVELEQATVEFVAGVYSGVWMGGRAGQAGRLLRG